MARFKIGDTIRQLRLGQLYRKGTVVKGPFNLEGLDHYQVHWTWQAEPRSSDARYGLESVEMVVDRDSKKYTIV